MMSHQDWRDESLPLLEDNIERPNYQSGRINISSSASSSSSSSTEDGSQQTAGNDNKAIDMATLVARRLSGASLYSILFGLWVGVFLSSLDSNIVATIYPHIGTEFKRSNEIVWIATAYMLSYTALQPLYGRVSDAFGRKSALLFAATAFFLGSFFCGVANDLWSLVAARLVAGIGGGGLNTMSSVITSDLVSLRERGKYQGLANIAYALGAVIGAPLGGFITDTVGWRYCFYINLPILLVTLYVSSALLTNYNLKEQAGQSTLWERFKKIDYMGSATIVSAVVCFMLASSFGGNSRPWSDPLVVGCIVASIVLIILFAVIEAKVAANPLMPWHIVTSQTPLACSVLNFFAHMCNFGITYTIPLFFQGLMDYSPSRAGLFFLPKVVFMSLGSVTAGQYMSRTGEYRRFLIAATTLSALSMAGYTLWTPTTSYYFIIPCLILDGFSSGCILTSTLVALLSCVRQHEMATVISMSYLFRSTGAVVGISGTSALFQGVVKTILMERFSGPDAERIIEIARKSMTEIHQRLSPEALRIVLDAYQNALRYAFGFCLLASAFCVLSALFVKQHKLENRK